MGSGMVDAIKGWAVILGRRPPLLLLLLVLQLACWDVNVDAWATTAFSGSGRPKSALQQQQQQQNDNDRYQCNYHQDVTSWLRQQNVSFRPLMSSSDLSEWLGPTTRQEDREKGLAPLPEGAVLLPKHLPKQSRFLEIVQSPSQQGTLLLHLIATPHSLNDCPVDPHFQRTLTDHLAQSSLDKKKKIIHLHQDIWLAKPQIVQSRLRTQFLNRQPPTKNNTSITIERIFARKTIAKRINATQAISFLQEHHLWGATKAKYYYGLFHPQQRPLISDATQQAQQELVAVATFSNRRKVLRGCEPGNQSSGILHSSHELLRFCTKRECHVVGGISKLIKYFVRQQNHPVDDLSTLVDRDWGDGSASWHQVGFATVRVFDSLVMIVSPNEPGIRRHLIGKGISNSDSTDESKGRLGLPLNVLEELDQLGHDSDSSSPAQLAYNHQQALRILVRHGYFPVYDSGVERLFMVMNSQSLDNGTEQTTSDKVLNLWRNSVPAHTTEHHSDNSGVRYLLKCAATGAGGKARREEQLQ